MTKKPLIARRNLALRYVEAIAAIRPLCEERDRLWDLRAEFDNTVIIAGVEVDLTPQLEAAIRAAFEKKYERLMALARDTQTALEND